MVITVVMYLKAKRFFYLPKFGAKDSVLKICMAIFMLNIQISHPKDKGTPIRRNQ